MVEGADTWGATIFEVRASDRTGLVADLARTFSSLGWAISLAKINTEGANVHDTFYAVPARDDGARDTGPVVAALLEQLESS